MAEEAVVVMTQEEEDGVKAITYLLKVGGKEEPTRVSLQNWRRMTEWQREQTLAAYAVVSGSGA